MRSPMISEFGKRARLYAALDCRLAAHTRFFGAAAVTNRALAELFSLCAGRLCLSSNTLGFLLQVGQCLEEINRRCASSIACGALGDSRASESAVAAGRVPATPARLFRNAAGYAYVLRAVSAELGHTASFAQQSDRECIGRTLIGRLRTPGTSLP